MLRSICPECGSFRLSYEASPDRWEAFPYVNSGNDGAAIEFFSCYDCGWRGSLRVIYER